MAYAERTDVPVEKSIAEAVSLVKRAGAVRTMQFEEPDQFVLQFELSGRMIRFSVKLQALDQIATRDGRGAALTGKQRAERLAQAHRQRARALLLVIKAKLESVESEVETFEQAFLANVVMADGQTVYERIAAPIAVEYATSRPQLLLPGSSVDE